MKQEVAARGPLSRARRPFALVLTTGAALLALPAMASAATQLVSPGGTDSADCTVTPCLHIQQAVNVAAPNDTVSIAAGTYDTEPNNQVVVNKGLIITGAGIGNTILDGNSAHGLAVNGTLNIQTSSTDPVSVSGLTIREPGTTAAVHGADNHYGIFTKSLAAAAPTYTLNAIRVEGNGAAGRDYNLYSVGDTSSLVITNSEFTGADFNPILLERHQGSVDFSDNTVTKTAGTAASAAVFDMNYSPTLPGVTNAVAAEHKFSGNTIDGGGVASGITVSARPTFGTAPLGGYTRVEVSDNSISNMAATSIGVSIANDTTDADGSDAEVQEADVTGNTITSPGATGIRIRGLVSNVDISGNQVVGGFTRGIQFAAALAGAHAPAASEVHLNRIVGATGQGIEQLAGGAVDAENNWWGCNEGPNADPGCTSVVGGSVDFDPWLVLGVSAIPPSVEVGGNDSNITADLTSNSDGAIPGTAHRDGFPVAWSTDLGTIAPPSSNVASGFATSTLTSGVTSGTANPAATVDNETVSTPVTFTDTGIPETQILTGPANNSTIAVNTPQFTFDSPNDPAATFECRVDSSDPVDFAPCISPFTTAALAEGPHTFEVRAVDVNSNADPSPARRAFIVDTIPEPPAGGVAGAVSANDGGACANRIAGTANADDLGGTNKGDRLLGFRGDDVLKGKSSYDCLKGGNGDDKLDGGVASDVVQGGAGNDTIAARDGKRDKVNCGSGVDTAQVDQYDVVRGCETAPLKLVFFAG